MACEKKPLKILEGPKIDPPIEQRGFGVLLFESLQKYSDRICQICSVTGQAETFRSVQEKSVRVAIEMRKRGIKPNDMITLCTKNRPFSCLPFLATLFLNGRLSNLDPSLSLRDTIHLLKLVGPKMIFCDSDAIDLISEAIKTGSIQVEVVVFGSTSKFIPFENFLRETTEEISFKPEAKDNIKHDAFVFFSSGTTGAPKGIRVSDYGMQFSIHSFLNFQYNLEVIAHFTSYYWVSAVMCLLASFIGGTKKLLCPTFDATKVLNDIEKYKVTFIFIAPVLTYALTEAHKVGEYDTSSLHTLIVSGSCVTGRQMFKIRQLFPQTHAFVIYGMSETSCYITSFFPETEEEFYLRKPTSCGRLTFQISLRIVDYETEEVLGVNQQGELRVKTPSIMNGYINEDSSMAFDSQGWLKTGDIGYYDEDRCLYIVDRIKDVFKFQSWHVIPSVLEAVFLEHPIVKEAVVFGFPHEVDGDVPMAIVTLKDYGGTDIESELEDFVEKRVSDKQRIRGGVKILKQIPRTPTGKVQRQFIKEMAIRGDI